MVKEKSFEELVKETDRDPSLFQICAGSNFGRRVAIKTVLPYQCCCSNKATV